MMARCHITLARTSPDDARERQVVVSLDGRKLATLMFGGTLTTEITPGAHRLRAHNTLVWKTLDFDIQPGQTARFRIVNRPGRGTFGLLSILGARPLYVELTQEP